MSIHRFHCTKGGESPKANSPRFQGMNQCPHLREKLNIITWLVAVAKTFFFLIFRLVEESWQIKKSESEILPGQSLPSVLKSLHTFVYFFSFLFLISAITI